MVSCGVKVVDVHKNTKFWYSQLRTFGVFALDVIVLLSHISMIHVDLIVFRVELVLKIYDVV